MGSCLTSYSLILMIAITCAFICRLYALGVINVDLVAKVLKCKENSPHFASNLRGYCRQVMNLGENSRLLQRAKLRALSPSRLGDSLWSCKLRSSSLLLSLSLSLPLSLSLALRCSTLSTSVEQEHRTESHLYTHVLCTHLHAHIRAHKHSLLQYPIRRSGFSNGIPSASSPGDGRCGSRVSEHSERLSRVLLIGDAAGSPLLFLSPVQESLLTTPLPGI